VATLPGARSSGWRTGGPSFSAPLQGGSVSGPVQWAALKAQVPPSGGRSLMPPSMEAPPSDTAGSPRRRPRAYGATLLRAAGAAWRPS